MPSINQLPGEPPPPPPVAGGAGVGVEGRVGVVVGGGAGVLAALSERVVTTPCWVILRSAALPVSATYTFPAASTDSALG